MTTVDAVIVDILSDTVLYEEARHFLQDHPNGVPNRQLMGLLTYSRDWRDLSDHLKHQLDRDWGNKRHYHAFYGDLDAYFKSLRQRVKADFDLVEKGLSHKVERDVLNQWVQALAQEFLQHLIAHAQYQAATATAGEA